MLKDYNAKTLQLQNITMIAKNYNDCKTLQWLQNITMIAKHHNTKILQWLQNITMLKHYNDNEKTLQWQKI